MSDIERAQGRIDELRAARARLEQKATAARSELAKLRAEAGARELAEVLTGEDRSADRARLAVLETQTAGLDGARALLIGKLTEAFRSRYKAEAEEVREQARKLEGEIEKHRRQTAKLLEALSTHEGCQFVPAYHLLVAESRAQPAGVIAAMGAGGQAQLPRSEVLASQIQALMGKAQAIEQRPAPLNGSVAGATRAELLAGIDTPDAVTPARSQVEAWFSEASAAADAAWERSEHQSHSNYTPAHKTWYTIGWRDGAIDPRQSGWQNRGTEQERRARVA